MARKSSTELNAIMKKMNVSRAWSWSKINCFHTSPYEYFLKYILKVKPDKDDSIYAPVGAMTHDILEKFYSNKIEYSDMIDMFSDSWTTSYEIAELKFDRNNGDKNNSIGRKYHSDLEHFFTHHVPIEHKLQLEQFIKTMINGNFFQGYADAVFKDEEGNVHIVDWKTSTIYKGKKAENECGQLIIYALGLNQCGIPMDKIRICWNFLKYCRVYIQQKNGIEKSREIERREIGEKLKKNVEMWLSEYKYSEEEIDNYINLLLETNDIKVLPIEIQSKYKIEDCYVYVPITDKLINKWIDYVTSTIRDIEAREKDFEKTRNEKVFWDTEESLKAQSYYLSTLCGYSPNKHKPYKEYLDKLNNKTVELCKISEDENAAETKTQSVSINLGDDFSWIDNL